MEDITDRPDPLVSLFLYDYRSRRRHGRFGSKTSQLAVLAKEQGFHEYNTYYDELDNGPNSGVLLQPR